MASKKVRYAVVGLGYFAQAAVLPAFAHAKKNSELVALVSGDKTKLTQLARKYKVENTYTYEQYDDLLQSGLIDAVYIVLPNHMHREYSERAAKAGIHVLCEKPLTANVDEALSVLKTFEETKTKLMTAYRLHFQKANLEAAKIANSGKLGDLRVFNSVFSMRVNDDNIRLNSQELGGGPVFDIGIYCINAARYIFREEPYEVFAYSSPGQDKRFKNVDEMVTAILRFNNGKIATFTCSFAGSPIAFYEVVGTKGSLCLDNCYEFAADMEMEISMANGKTQTRKYKKTDQVAPEIVYFSDCVIRDKMPEPRGYEGYLDMRVIEAILESIRLGRPVRLDLKEKRDKPDSSQQMRRPAVKEQDLIHAQNPSMD